MLPTLGAAVSLKNLVTTPQDGGAFMTPGPAAMRTPALKGVLSEPAGANVLSQSPSARHDLDMAEIVESKHGAHQQKGRMATQVRGGSPTDATRVAATATLEASMSAMSEHGGMAPRHIVKPPRFSHTRNPNLDPAVAAALSPQLRTPMPRETTLTTVPSKNKLLVPGPG